MIQKVPIHALCYNWSFILGASLSILIPSLEPVTSYKNKLLKYIKVKVSQNCKKELKKKQ